MKILISLVSMAIGVWVLHQTRKWFFESDKDFWESFGDGRTPDLFSMSRGKYLDLDGKGGKLRIITWLMIGVLGCLLGYVLLNILFF